MLFGFIYLLIIIIIESISKLVFYAQSTGTVRSGRGLKWNTNKTEKVFVVIFNSTCSTKSRTYSYYLMNYGRGLVKCEFSEPGHTVLAHELIKKLSTFFCSFFRFESCV